MHKKPENQKAPSPSKRVPKSCWRLRGGGWVMVNKKPAADKNNLKGSKPFWRLKGGLGDGE